MFETIKALLASVTSNPFSAPFSFQFGAGSTTMTPSPNDTVITTVGPAITDSAGNKWTITSTAKVAENGITDTTTANVIELAYVNGIVWHENTSKMWYSKTSSGWSSGTLTSPLPATPTITHTTIQAQIDQATAILASARANLASLSP